VSTRRTLEALGAVTWVSLGALGLKLLQLALRGDGWSAGVLACCAVILGCVLVEIETLKASDSE
jgi:hypothetical protein